MGNGKTQTRDYYFVAPANLSLLRAPESQRESAARYNLALTCTSWEAAARKT